MEQYKFWETCMEMIEEGKVIESEKYGIEIAKQLGLEQELLDKIFAVNLKSKESAPRQCSEPTKTTLSNAERTTSGLAQRRRDVQVEGVVAEFRRCAKPPPVSGKRRTAQWDNDSET